MNSQYNLKKKNIELTTRRIFDIKLKSNDFNNIILNEVNGFQNIFYLKNKKIYQLLLRKKKKQELDILKNQEIIFLTTNLNHDSLICLTNNGCIFSINYETFKIKYFSNLDFNKFIIPNVIAPKKRSFSFSKKTSDKNNYSNLNYIYNIFCNNSSDKVVLNLNKYILFWYQNNYNIDNNNINNNIELGNKIENVTGTIYSIIKDNEIEKLGLKKEKNNLNINNNKMNININSNLKEYEIINEGVETVFANNYFLGSHTRIFYVVLVNFNNVIKLYIFDYLFKFNYKNRFRCIADTPKNDFSSTDLFNGAENEDLNDIKSKISSTNIYFHNNIISNNNNINLIKNEINNSNINNKLKGNQILIKSNYKGNALAIIINDDMNNTNILNMNSTLIFFMTETYSFSMKKIVNIIGNKLLNNQNSLYISAMDWICNDMFLIILTSKGYFFLVNINFQVIYLADIDIVNSLSNYDTYYIPSLLEKTYFNSNKKNDITYLNLYVSKQREDLFMISDSNYIVCYQINSKMYENKIINMEIPQEHFQKFLFLLKYYQLYSSQAQFDYLTPEELSSSIIDLMSKHLQSLIKKVENIAPIPKSEDEIIQTDTGIKIMKTKQNDEEDKLDENKKGDLDYFKNLQNNLTKNEMNNSLYINLVKFIKIFSSLNLLHETNLSLMNFIISKSIDFLIHLMNHKELWLAVIFLELCEKYLCNQFLLFKNAGEDNFNFNKDKKNCLSEIIFKSKEINAFNSEKFIPYFFDNFKNYSKAPINQAIFIRMKLLLIFFCLIEFRNNPNANMNVFFFILAKLLVEKMKEKQALDDIYKVTKVIIKNYKYLKQENDKQGKDEFILSSFSLSYRNEFFSDLKITKTEREDLNFEFFAEFYTIDDFGAYAEPTENFCKNDDVYLLSEFNYLNNTGVLQKWVIFMTNYLFIDLLQDIKKFMDNHLRQMKDKAESNISPEEKSLTKLVFFNMVFILQYLQNFLKDVILFLTQKESCFSENYNKFNIHTNNIYKIDIKKENEENTQDDNKDNNANKDNNTSDNIDDNNVEENFNHYSDKIQDDFNRVLFRSLSPVDIHFLIFSFYLQETNPENKSKAYDINKELGDKIRSISRQCALSLDDLFELIGFIHLNGFNYINNNIINNDMENNIMIDQLEPVKRIQNYIFTSFLFYFFILHKLNLIYLLESELNLLYDVIDALNMNQRKQLYELIFIITNGTLKYFLRLQFNHKINAVESKYMEILLTFDKILFYKIIKEESCFVRKNLADFVKISPSIMSSYLLEGALYYEYKNLNKICKKIVSLDKIILNNIYFINNISNNNSGNRKKIIKIPNNVSIFEILYGMSGTENNTNSNINNNYGNDKKIYKQILKVLFNNEKTVIKQFLIILNNIVKLLQLKHVSNDINSNSDYLIFNLENDQNYIKDIINRKISESNFNNKEEEDNNNNEDEISKNIFCIIDSIIKGNFDDRKYFKFNNSEIKAKLVRNLKLIISKLLHLFFEIQIKINLLLFENKGTPQSKINYIYLLSQALLCEQNPKISKKIISDILTFIKLLNIKKVLSTNNINSAEIKQSLIDVMKNLEISIIINFQAEFELKRVTEILQNLGIKLINLINFKEIENLTKIVPQVTSKKLKNFLLLGGCPITWYIPTIHSIYKNLLIFVKAKPPENFLIKARKQYAKLSEAFYNMIGIPQKCFIEFGDNWDLVEREQLYFDIIIDDLEDHLYNDSKSKIILNNRQKAGRETPRKIRKNSISKYNMNNKAKIDKKEKNKDNINIINKDNINIKINNIDNDNIKYNKLLKIKKGKEINNENIINIASNSKNKIFYLKKTVRKMIFNRFIHNIFLFIEKGKESTYKIYSISDNNKNPKNVEVILLNPIFIV